MTVRKLTLLLAAASFSFGLNGLKADEPSQILSKPASGIEHLSGELSNEVKHHDGKKGGKKSESTDLVIHVAKHHGKKAGEKGAQHGKTVKLTASGDILKKLTSLAEKHAHVKVSGTIRGDSMTVTDVTEQHLKGKAK